MTKTKHIGVESNNLSHFTKELDRISSVYEVFATQTHITKDADGEFIYTAICFYRERTE